MPAQRLNAKLFHPPKTSYCPIRTWIAVLHDREEAVQNSKAGCRASGPLYFCFSALMLEHLTLTLCVEKKLRVVAGVLNDKAVLLGRRLDRYEPLQCPPTRQ